MRFLFLLSWSPQPVTPLGCTEDVCRRSLSEITLQKRLFVCTRHPAKKAFDGMKCPVHHPLPHTSHYLCLLLLLVHDPCAQPCRTEVFSFCQSVRTGLQKRTQRSWLGWLLANKPQRPWLLSLIVRKELTPVWGEVGGWVGDQTLDSVVTDCVINAAVCPVPKTFSTSGPFSDSGRELEREVSRRRGGASGAPLCHCICPERGSGLQLGLRRMTPRQAWSYGRQQVSNDGCVEAEGVW